ncbi:FAD-dependent oxidoreductase [Mycobacterium sherrisii]|uniref:FAD-dependent oxidoreductase n=2 Tax=Mycobacterium sherrisii TaxID=243061 RepID=UPI000A169F25|nr:FAD-dependent oxidoreductase [Mycobacterium sherrisii]MCV7028968.1 FAD-dependent oxidoreductase [Mycobacterium sherrisii]ORW82894.1 FAD-dependent oxidoreductase [Mycobacterium sherrisii]
MGSTTNSADLRDRLGQHAVVLGAGMAGLLAARVLSEFYESVSVVERDWLPDYPIDRKGIPQGRHVHNFLGRGVQALVELFPGLLGELATAGAVVMDDGDLSRVYGRIGRYEFKRSGTLADPSPLTLCLASRPFVEFHVRRRVKALRNVTFLDGHDVLEPVATADGITGVRIRKRDSGFERTLTAALVVDAMGRATRTPAFLAGLGYGRPTEDRAPAKLGYSTQRLSITKGRIAERLVMFNPGGGRPRGLLLAGEHDTWMLTIGQPTAHGGPPADFAAMFAAAERVLPPAICHGLRAAQPIGEVVTYHHTAALWRRYDLMPRFPSGLLVIGDAVCSLDPSYGQGMTIAALQAQTLRDCLRSGETQLAQRFFGAAARYVGSTWAGNQIRDRIDAPARGAHGRAGGWVVRAALNAAANDVVLTERILRVVNLLDPPGRLHDPALLPRIVLGNARAVFARRRRGASRAASPQPGTPIPAIAGC